MENKVKCSICEKEYYKRGILTHMMRMHGTKEQKSLFVCAGNGPALAAIRLKYDARIADYDAHPAKCKNCLSSLTYAKKFENFCNRSCAAKYNNANRSPTAKKPGPPRGIYLRIEIIIELLKHRQLPLL